MSATPTFYEMLVNLGAHLGESHWPSLSIAALALGVIWLVRRFKTNWPSSLLGMVAAGAAVAIFDLGANGVVVLSELPRTLPPFTAVNLFDLETINAMYTGRASVRPFPACLFC